MEHIFEGIAQDLRDELSAEGIVGLSAANASIAARIAARPSLMFDAGLCAGYPLIPSPHEYFVAQEFSPDRADLFRAVEGAFEGFLLRPYRADQDALPGHLLCKIAAKLHTTLFSVFELTRTQNRNVYLELGVAIGLRQYFLLIKEPDAEIAHLAQGLDHYTLRSYGALKRELGPLYREYLVNLTRYRAPTLPLPGSSATCVIAHGDYDMSEDFCDSIEGAFVGRTVECLRLGTDWIGQAGKSRLEAAVEAIQRAQLGVYRVDSGCSADAFLALGISIGLNRPWLLVSRKGAALPSDVRGLSSFQFGSFTQLSKDFPIRFRTLLDMVLV